jgi:hypothetical protein
LHENGRSEILILVPPIIVWGTCQQVDRKSSDDGLTSRKGKKSSSTRKECTARNGRSARVVKEAVPAACF